MTELTAMEHDLSSDDMQEIGKAAMWKISCAKPGNGIDQLIDDDVCNPENLSWIMF